MKRGLVILALLAATALVLWLLGIAQYWPGVDNASDKSVDRRTPDLIEGVVEPTAPELRGARPAAVEEPDPDLTPLRVALLLPDRTPAPGGSIHWWVEGSPRRNLAAWMPERPTIQVPRGTVWVRGMRYQYQATESVQVETARSNGVTLRLQEDSGIRGRVTLSATLSTKRAAVYALPIRDAGAPRWLRVDDHPDARKTKVRRLEPTYDFGRLEPGWYAIAFAFGTEIDHLETVEVTNYTVVHDISLVSLPGAPYSPLRVDGLGIGALNRLKFSAEIVEGDRPMGVTVIPTTRQTFLVRPVAPLDEAGLPISLADAELRILVESTQRGRQVAAFGAGQSETIEVKFPDLIEVVVRFTGLVRPHQFRAVVGPTDLIDPSAIDSQGVCRARTAQWGRNVVRVLSFNNPGVEEIDRFEIEVTPEKRAFEFPVRALWTVRLASVGVPGVPRYALRGTGQHRSFVRRPAGSPKEGYVFLNIRTGTYELHDLFRPDVVVRTIEVNRNMTVRLD